MLLFLVSLLAGRGLMMGTVVQACNLSMWEAKADKLLWVSSQYGLDMGLPQISTQKGGGKD